MEAALKAPAGDSPGRAVSEHRLPPADRGARYVDPVYPPGIVFQKPIQPANPTRGLATCLRSARALFFAPLAAPPAQSPDALGRRCTRRAAGVHVEARTKRRSSPRPQFRSGRRRMEACGRARRIRLRCGPMSVRTGPSPEGFRTTRRATSRNGARRRTVSEAFGDNGARRSPSSRWRKRGEKVTFEVTDRSPLDRRVLVDTGLWSRRNPLDGRGSRQERFRFASMETGRARRDQAATREQRPRQVTAWSGAGR